MKEKRHPIFLELRIDPSDRPLVLFDVSYCDGSNGWVKIKSVQDMCALVSLLPIPLRKDFLRALTDFMSAPERPMPERTAMPDAEAVYLGDVPTSC